MTRSYNRCKEASDRSQKSSREESQECGTQIEKRGQSPSTVSRRRTATCACISITVAQLIGQIELWSEEMSMTLEFLWTALRACFCGYGGAVA